jgi:hypothetical protein
MKLISNRTGLVGRLEDLMFSLRASEHRSYNMIAEVWEAPPTTMLPMWRWV